MTVRLDVFGDIPRLFQYFVNDSNILRKIQLFCESFQYVVSYSIILWIIAIYCESFPYIVNFSNVWWIIPMYCELFQYFVNNSNILWIHKMIELFIKYWNLSKVARRSNNFQTYRTVRDSLSRSKTHFTF